MGKGVIVSGGADGLYTVRLELDRARVNARIAAIDARTTQINNIDLIQAEADLLETQNDIDAIKSDLDNAIRDWDNLTDWQPNTDYSEQFSLTGIKTGVGFSAVVEIPGRSGAQEPAWTNKDGETVRENEMVWSCVAADSHPHDGSWFSSTDYTIGTELEVVTNFVFVIDDPDTGAGHFQHLYATAQTNGRSGLSTPSWAEGTIIEGGILWRQRDRLSEITRLVKKLADLSLELAKRREARDRLKLERESIRREKQYLQDTMPADPEVSAWCVDLTEDLAAALEVGTIEVPGERKGVPVLIRPGYVDQAKSLAGAAYDTARDGQLQPTVASTKFGVAWNIAMLPGWQKWKPTYRLGTITALTGDTCNVDLDPAASSAQDLDINQATSLTNVSILYMACDGAAFAVNDRVVVEFEDQDWTKPRVIGFEQMPQPCPGIYEFFTSNHIDSITLSNPSFPGFNCGSGTLAAIAGSAGPAFSVNPPPTPPPDNEWTQITCDDLNPPAWWPTLYSWQRQKFQEHCWWPDNAADRLVTSTQGWPSGKSNALGYHAWAGEFAGLDPVQSTFDQGLDQPPAFYAEGIAWTGVPDTGGAWWRRAAVQTVTDATHGTRDFFLMTDHVGRFFVYPVQNYTPGTTVDPALVRTLTPPYPAWASVAALTGVTAYNHWTWEFNRDATKAVTIAWSVVDVEFDWRKTMASSVNSVIRPYQPAQAGEQQARDDRPGLIEIGISISLTGPNPEDFTASLSLLQTEHFDANGRYFVGAAYALPGIDGVAEDALIVAEIECYYPGGDYLISDSDLSTFWDFFDEGNLVQYPRASMLDIDPIESFCVLKTWPTGAEIRRFMTGRYKSYPWKTGSALPYETWSYIVGYDGGFGGIIPAERSRTVFGTMHSLDIRSCSWMVEYVAFDDSAGDRHSKFELGAFNEAFEVKYDGDPAVIASRNFTQTEVTKVPAGGLTAYQYEGLRAFSRTGMDRMFKVHPIGHWAYCDPAIAVRQNLGFDRVQPKGKNSTTHKALYNEAFLDARDETWYDYSAPGAYDRGGFGTAGIWRTFILV